MKTHPNACPCLHTLLPDWPVQCKVTPPLASFPFCYYCLNYFPQTSPTTRPVPCWVPGIASAGKAKCVNRMGEGSWLGGAGCPGTGISRGTQGMGILGEVPAPHVLCFLMCLSRHRPVASNLPVTSPALNIQDLLKGRTVLRCLPFAGRSSACFPWPGDPVHPWTVSIHHLG